MNLTKYRAKRDFTRTAEPSGRSSPHQRTGRRVLFVIQKHAARRLHYDFRLELDGVLKSWAVPKGVPVVQGEKRLAVQVEDHPVEYANFEGTIPAGNYGAGTVMLWDAGIGQVLDKEPRQALREGKLVLHLQGQKLKGHWTLVRMRVREEAESNTWLLIKTEEDAPRISVRAEDRSVLSGRTMKQIAAQGGPTWQSNRNQAVRRASGRATRPASRVRLRRR
jgi:bifunctional non-homologous end joining protein LigD